LLNSRNRLGLSVVETMQQDIAANGLGRIARLRAEQPGAWAKLACELGRSPPGSATRRISTAIRGRGGAAGRVAAPPGRQSMTAIG
jgi:hypothetical protein